jgi:hypothetical protein
MPKSISERVEESFNEDNSEEIEKFLDWTLARVQDYAQSLRRNFALIILLVAAFELVNQTNNGSVTIASFHLDKGSVALQFIPPLVAFLYLQSIIDNGLAGRQIAAFQALLRKWAPKAADNDLFILPVAVPMPIYWNNLVGLQKEIHDYRSDKVETLASLTIAMALLIGVIVFEAQAYYALYSANLHRDILWGISLLVTIFCLVMSALDYFS